MKGIKVPRSSECRGSCLGMMLWAGSVGGVRARLTDDLARGMDGFVGMLLCGVGLGGNHSLCFSSWKAFPVGSSDLPVFLHR